MRTTRRFTVNGQPVVVPDADLALQEEDVISTDSGPDESGVYHRFSLGRTVKSWDFSYARLNWEEYAYMESLFDGKNTFSFGFMSATDGSWQEVVAYRSKRSILWHNATDEQFREYRFRITEC